MTFVGERPLITTVIPTYRRPKLLRRAIYSALQQSFAGVEVLVCDNASGDSTEEVVREIAARDPRVVYHRHATNLGSYNNFNFGIRHVRTPLFSLLSDDDVLLPDFYAESLKALDRFPQAVFACMATMVIDVLGNVLSEPVLVSEVTLHQAAAGLIGPVLRPIPGAWTGILIRTRVREDIGLIDVDAGPFADGGFVMHMAARFPFVDVPGVGAVLMAHNQSTSGTVKLVDREWLTWWTNMVRRIESDMLIPDTARARVRSKRVMDVTAFDIGQIAARQVVQSLFRGDIERAKKAADGAGQCHYTTIARLLRLLVWLERYTRAVRPVLCLLHTSQRKLPHQDTGDHCLKYAHELSIIRKIEQAAYGSS